MRPGSHGAERQPRAAPCSGPLCAKPDPMRQPSAERVSAEPASTGVDRIPAPGERRAAVEKRWTENQAAKGWLPRLDLAEAWASREIAFVLALRNIKIRYKQTFFGVVWTILQPLAGVAIFTLIFGRLAEVPSEGIPYPVFVYAGLAGWLYFSQSTSLASESLAQYRELVTKVYFPRLLAPLAAVVPGLVDLGVSLLAVGVFMAIFGVAPTGAIVFLPLWVAGLVVLTFGVGVWLSALNVQYRDVRNALAFMLQLWFFATPVVYGSSLLEGKWGFFLALNPLVGLLDGFRWSLVGAPAPGPEALVSLAAGIVILATGLAYFGRAQHRFADLI
jgi:lipopolysaccharide transport system permease protein